MCDVDGTRTIYCGTFSKTLAPGLRIGWACGASDVISRLVILKQAGDLHTSTINQAALDLVARSVFSSQVDKVREAYAGRRDHILAALKREMSAGVSWTEPEGGMFIWVTLPKHIDGKRLLEASIKSARVAFVPGQAFFPDGSGANTIRLSFSCASPDMIDAGIERLAKLIRSQAV